MPCHDDNIHSPCSQRPFFNPLGMHHHGHRLSMYTPSPWRVVPTRYSRGVPRSALPGPNRRHKLASPGPVRPRWDKPVPRCDVPGAVVRGCRPSPYPTGGEAGRGTGCEGAQTDDAGTEAAGTTGGWRLSRSLARLEGGAHSPRGRQGEAGQYSRCGGPHVEGKHRSRRKPAGYPAGGGLHVRAGVRAFVVRR